MDYENRYNFPLSSPSVVELIHNKARNSNKPNRVIINVGGTKHECYISTIQNFPDTRLSWIAETALKNADFDPEQNEFFFDRHPGCFQNIMNYCRTGKLHCPNDVCGPLFEQELIFWGVDEQMMEPCCWSNYTQHRDAHKNLKMFDSLIHKTKEASEEEIEALKLKYKNMAPWRQLLSKGRAHLWDILEEPFSSFSAQVTALVSLMVIIVSVTTFCLQTMKHFNKHKALFSKLEYGYCVVFTLEFLLRLASCPSLKKFFRQPITYIDLTSTMQFYLSYLLNTSAVDFLFASRLVRLLRLFRFFKKLSGMQVIGQTLKASFNELMLLTLIFMIPMVVFSTLVYYAEKNFSTKTDFESIPESFWWAIVSMTTVGYGDMVPRSGPSKVIGAMCACCGILIVALPVSVVGRNFALFYSYAQARIKLPQRKSPTLISADRTLVNNDNAVYEAGLKTLSVVKKKKREEVNTEPVIQDPASVMLKLMVPQKHGRRNAYTPPIEPRRCKTDLRALTPIGSHSEISIRTQYNDSIASELDQPEPIIKSDSLENEMRSQLCESPTVNCNNDGSALFHSQSYEHFINPYKSLRSSNLRQVKSLQNISNISEVETNENKSFSQRHTSSRTKLIDQID